MAARQHTYAPNAGMPGWRRALAIAPPYRLTFESLQPGKEAGGYRLVVAQPQPEGNPWWFEFDRTGLGVWTTSNGGWAPRWQADGLRPDTWYRVLVDDQEERVRFALTDLTGKSVAQSDWLPHDLGGSAPLTFRADSGSGLRGAVFDGISVTLPVGAAVRRVATSVDRALHEALRAAPPATGGRLVRLATQDVLELALDGSGRAARLRLGGMDAAPRGGARYGGLYAWDITQPPEHHRFAARGSPSADGDLDLRCPRLGLGLRVTVRAMGDRVSLTGGLADVNVLGRPGRRWVWKVQWWRTICRCQPIRVAGLMSIRQSRSSCCLLCAQTSNSIGFSVRLSRGRFPTWRCRMSTCCRRARIWRSRSSRSRPESREAGGGNSSGSGCQSMRRG